MTQRLLWAALAVTLLAIAAAGVHRLVFRPVSEPLPVLGTLPAFELEERSGRPLGSDDLVGSIWVADFIFTRCGGICPVLSAAMARLEGELAARGASDVRLVSFTVDPAHDTEAVLGAYAERFAAGERWSFLTGERRAIHELVRDGFRLSVAEAPPGAEVDPSELVTHSDRLVIVDRHLRIRAYHHGTEPEAVDAVLADVDRLRRER